MRRVLLCSALVASLSCGSNSGSSAVANKCLTPRTGTDPFSGQRYPDQQGSADDEKEWLRRWIDELYLWYREVPKNLKAQDYTVLQWFDKLKTPATTPSGKPKDQFHFTINTATFNAESQSGVEVGYGVQWALVARSPPRKALAAFVDPATPAATAGLTRGAEVTAVDGVAVLNGDAAPLNAGLFPVAAGETHTFSIVDRGGTTPHDVTLKSQAISSPPVQHAALIPGTTVGYMQFNTFNFVAEKALADAIAALISAGAKDLVLDLRYNGGGIVNVAAELGYMIASPSRTTGKTFEKIAFNDKYPDHDPVTGAALTPVTFAPAAAGYSLPRNQALPHLDLDRVYILTGSGTASASEAVINALIGVDVQVMLFGATTVGKPYGFYPQDNCGTTYFSIQFEGQNAKGFGEYSDGFVPGAGGPAGPPGCIVADDFSHDLGDPAEGRLAAALGYRANQTCPPVPTARDGSPAPREDFYLGDHPFRQNRIYPRPR